MLKDNADNAHSKPPTKNTAQKNETPNAPSLDPLPSGQSQLLDVSHTPNFKQCIPQAAASKRRFLWDMARRAAGYTADELRR